LSKGEYLSDSDFTGWRYETALSPLNFQMAAAHVSWIAGDVGILMLDDLLPQFSAGERPAAATIRIEMPSGWQAFSADRGKPGDLIDASDLRRTVILIGKGLESATTTVGDSRIQIVRAGKWQFTMDQAAEAATEIYSAYRELFGHGIGSDVCIVFVRFPDDVGPGVWAAETRGRSVVIVSGDMQFSTQSYQRMHEQLRHELFHLWMPNGVELSGNYDWFYEGFALYQALKTGVILGRIRFDDLLDTLTRAYLIDERMRPRASLISLSRDRFGGRNTEVYARGMLVAFIADIRMLRSSGGRRSVGDLIRLVYNKHRTPLRTADGNAAVLNVIRSYRELAIIADRYVEGSEPIDWAADLSGVGLDWRTDDESRRLRVKEKPGGRERQLLDKLGYNSWRKLLRRSK
jgi:predicted metalloprotease with PDZ domain